MTKCSAGISYKVNDDTEREREREREIEREREREKVRVRERIEIINEEYIQYLIFKLDFEVGRLIWPSVYNQAT